MRKTIQGKLFIFLSIIVLFAFFFWVYKGFRSETPPQSTPRGDVTYPTVYQKEGLPKYENGTLIEVSIENPTSPGNIRLSLTTSDEVSKVADFYEQQIGKLGWTTSGQRIAVPDLYLASWEKNELYYQATISKEKGEEKTKIVVIFSKD